MNFVLANPAAIAPAPEPIFVLTKDNWNDWFIWHTLYSVTAILPNGTRMSLGGVKIGRKGMSQADASTQLPLGFSTLDSNYFSIGMDENYYETLNSLGFTFTKQYLEAMRDCAYALEILEENKDEPVLSSSLLRDIDDYRVRSRFHRLAHGQAALTTYSFEYNFPVDASALTLPPTLSFEVTPNSLPATNIHVLIGRNGVGKTRCFDFLARTFLGIPAEDQKQETGFLRNRIKPTFPAFTPTETDPGFSGLVTVSFSAFDSKGPLVTEAQASKKYAYVGLVQSQNAQPGNSNAKPILRVKTLQELADEFANSVVACREGVRRSRWERALNTLEADPLFAEANVASLANDEVNGGKSRAQRLFMTLSSGHAAVLLSITRLVEFVEEESLVLIDEPEGHLHPPLLAAFVRALSDLLINRNGVAIIATHSPVVLQEVPRSCVWKLDRTGKEARADRPELETFGENVGILTREVFGLEVTQTGFHKLIAEKSIGRTYDEVIELFRNQLGAEGRGLARILSLLSLGNDVEE